MPNRSSIEFCPSCRVIALQPLTLLLGSVVDACPRCDGVWTDALELEWICETLVGPSPRLVRVQTDVRAAPCPVCGDRMSYAALPGVVLQTCDRHGMWFEAGELQTVLRAAGAATDAVSHPMFLGDSVYEWFMCRDEDWTTAESAD